MSTQANKTPDSKGLARAEAQTARSAIPATRSTKCIDSAPGLCWAFVNQARTCGDCSGVSHVVKG
jgi:hypothetical protein